MDAPEANKNHWIRKLHWQILLALIAAVVVGGICYALDYRLFDGYGVHGDGSTKSVFWYPGHIWLRLLKMIVLPLIITSIIVGVSSLDPTKLGRVGGKTFLYYAGTTACAVVIGLFVVNMLQPGVGADLSASSPPSVQPAPVDEMLISIIPTNPVDSLVSSHTHPDDGVKTRGAEVISIIFFSILFGLAITITGTRARPVKELFEAANEVVMKMTMWIMALAPIGVFGLLAHTIVTTGFDTFDELAVYMVTVVLGLSIHGLVVLPLLLWIFARRRGHVYAKEMSPALLTAFSTSSSSATLPVTINSAEKRAGVPRSIAEFVLPLGATVNMDGTALYEAVAVLFIAQAYGVDLTLSAQILVALTATMAAIGAAGVPSAGTVMMILVLQAVNLPVEGIGLILAVDRILDMCRTTVNVWGDSIGAAIIGAREG